MQGEYENWNDSENWNDKWQNWNNNEGNQQPQQPQQQQQQQASSSSQPNVRMVRQAQGTESVRRVMQESTVTIEEIEEDEVVDFIGMFNNLASRAQIRMVKEKPVRFQTKRLFPSDSEDGMSKKEQRETILYTATKLAKLQLEHRNYPKNEIKRRANVLRAQWNEMKELNDMVKEILDYLKDYPERPGRTEFLERLEEVYGIHVGG